MSDDSQAQKVEPTNGLVRVEDSLGRLLFMYNKVTRCIEYIPMRAGKFQGTRREKYIIDTDKLRAFGLQNLLSDNPSNVFVVEEMENA